MTDEDFQKLTQRVEFAKQSLTMWTEEYDQAKAEWNAERLRRSGLVGKIATNCRSQQFKIVVQGVRFAGSTPAILFGKLLNRDGSASHRDATLRFDNAQISEFIGSFP